jgi:hypothetical protein
LAPACLARLGGARSVQVQWGRLRGMERSHRDAGGSRVRYCWLESTPGKRIASQPGLKTNSAGCFSARACPIHLACVAQPVRIDRQRLHGDPIVPPCEPRLQHGCIRSVCGSTGGLSIPVHSASLVHLCSLDTKAQGKPPNSNYKTRWADRTMWRLSRRRRRNPRLDPW